MIDKQFTYQQMFRHACAFAECADMALEKENHETADIESYFTPATVNSAFACEVYLKALLLFYDIKIGKQHKIKELYEMLPEQAKNGIRSEITNTYDGKWYDLFWLESLEHISDAFVEWRYYYENLEQTHEIRLIFLTTFRDALREACCQLFFHVTWEKYERGSNG